MRLDNVKLRNYAQRKLMKFLSDKIQPVNLVEEILHLFNDNGDFYVCFEKNLTLSAQRLFIFCGLILIIRILVKIFNKKTFF